MQVEVLEKRIVFVELQRRFASESEKTDWFESAHQLLLCSRIMTYGFMANLNMCMKGAKITFRKTNVYRAVILFVFSILNTERMK